MTPSAIPQSFRDAVQTLQGWSGLVHLSPEQASSVMSIRLGRKVLPADADDALRRARLRAARRDRAEDTVSDFKRDSIGKRLGGGCSTTDLYKLITGVRALE